MTPIDLEPAPEPRPPARLSRALPLALAAGALAYHAAYRAVAWWCEGVTWLHAGAGS